MDTMAILLAEDDRALSALICDFFRAAKLEVFPAYDGEEALLAARGNAFDLIILDVMLPKYDGLSVCRELRQMCDAPVIFVTALGQEYDQLAGYRAGADDYITKPFSFPVLVAKAQAIMRRAAGRGLAPGELEYGNITLSPSERRAWVDGQELPLRPKEYQILEVLMRSHGRTVPRDTLILQVWGDDFEGDERMLDRHIASLRKSLGTGGVHIKAVYGQGYRLGGTT